MVENAEGKFFLMIIGLTFHEYRKSSSDIAEVVLTVGGQTDSLLLVCLLTEMKKEFSFIDIFLPAMQAVFLIHRFSDLDTGRFPIS